MAVHWCEDDFRARRSDSLFLRRGIRGRGWISGAVHEVFV